MEIENKTPANFSETEIEFSKSGRLPLTPAMLEINKYIKSDKGLHGISNTFTIPLSLMVPVTL